MAGKRNKSVLNFYETLAASVMEGIGVPGKSRPPRHRRSKNKKDQKLGRKADFIALGHDLLMYLRRLMAVFASLPARALYFTALLLFVVGLGFFAVRTAFGTMSQYSSYLNNPTKIMNMKNTGTTILDRNGVVLFQGYGAVQRHNISLSEMPSSLKQATLATEDPGFYQEPGFSWKGMLRAFVYDASHRGNHLQGGSTITQQLVKNTLLTPQQSLIRKYKEILLSMELERRYSKDQILQMYLNTIYYGEGAYGAESAAQTYFHESAKDLTPAESAMLAGLPQSPSTFDPNLNLPAALDRRNYVISRMRLMGYINDQTAATIDASPIHAGTGQQVIRAPHFVFYVLDQLRQQYGSDMIVHGGIVVHTTLDYNQQQQAEQIVANHISQLSSHHVTNGGLVALDPHTGEVRTMVGSVDYNNPDFGNVNVTLSELQPGSSFKPIAYITAFQKGWNGATRVMDSAETFPGNPPYTPHDYDNKFRGPVLLRRALANSLNLPAIHVLQYAGLSETLSMAHKLGVQTSDLANQADYGLSLVLGGGDVRPIDMAAVYATLDNGGVRISPRAITQVKDRFGQDITKPEPKPSKQPVVDPRLTFMITNILSDTKARQEEFGQNNPLQLDRPAAAKTGTTNDFRDNWTIGYTPDLVTAVWVGNNDHSPMNNVDGITGAAPIWHDFMESSLAGTPVHDFAIPAGVVFVKVCASDGGLANANDPTAINEVFLAENQPTKHCGANGSPAPPPLLAQPSTPTPTPVAQASVQPPGQGDASNPNQPQSPQQPNNPPQQPPSPNNPKPGPKQGG